MQFAPTVAHYLWPHREFDPQFISDFEDYIQERMDNIHCCVLWTPKGDVSLALDFRDFLQRHGMPECGLREVIINEQGRIYYYADYRKSAKL